MTKYQREVEDEQAALRGLASRMAGSAELAERAAYRSLTVRCFVLLVLRWSEFVARRYLVQACRDYGLAVPAFALLTAFHLDFGTRADALRLAQNFRDLAEEFEALAGCPPPLEHPFWRAMSTLERLSHPPMAFRGSGASTKQGTLSVIRLCVAANTNREPTTSVAPNQVVRSGRLLRAYPAPS